MGFLGKAKKMMGRGGSSEPPRPQYYRVACALGHVIQGERTDGYQALRCPHCGDGVFVLPRSPLPLPPAPPSKPKPKRTAVEPEFYDEAIELTEAPPQPPPGRSHPQPQADLDEIEWMDPEPVAPVATSAPATPLDPADAAMAEAQAEPPIIPARPKKPRPVARSRSRPSAVEADEPATSPTARGPMIADGMVAIPARPRRRGRVGLVLAGVVVLVAATYAFRTYRARLQELPHIAEVNAAEGKEALERGRFDEAKTKLTRAARAYRDLRLSDATATETFQLAKEAAILADLGRNEPKEIVEEVARLGDPEGPEQFNTLYKGQSILVDSDVKSASPTVELRYTILVGRGPAPAKVGKLDLKGFRLFEGRDMKSERHVIFGARLESIRQEGNVWWITLQPDSGVWMSNAKALAVAFQETPPS